MGYAIIAAAMALALMATVPLFAGSLPRMMQLLTGLLETGF